MKKRLFNLIFVLMLFFLSTSLGSQSMNIVLPETVFPVNDSKTPILFSYTTQTPISINNDSDLATYSVGGTGLSDNPYILGGWNITIEASDPYQYGIVVTNTTQYFVIENCWISGALDAGIYVYDVATSTTNVSNNICGQNNKGIQLNDVNYAIVEKNLCINNNGSGMYLNQIEDTLIHNNTCSNNDQYGIEIYGYSDYLTISENILAGNELTGLRLQFCRYSSIFNNRYFSNQNYGLYLFDCFDITITENNLTDNLDYGFYIGDACEQILIHHNYFYYNNPGGDAQAYDFSMMCLWYDNINKIGNYWSGWTQGSYTIPGMNRVDLYPIDLEPPLVDPVQDIEYAYGATGNSIQWNVTDLYPDDYVILKDFEKLDSDTWTNDVPIILNIDGLEVGTHYYQLLLFDEEKRLTLDTVIVTVTPTIKEFSDNIILFSITMFLITLFCVIKNKKKRRVAI